MSKANAWQWYWNGFNFRRTLGPLVLVWALNHFDLGAQLSPDEKRLICIPAKPMHFLRHIHIKISLHFLLPFIGLENEILSVKL